MSMSRDSTSLKKSSGDCLKLANYVIQHLSEMMLFQNFCIISGSVVETIASTDCLLSGKTCAKY